MDLIVEFLHLNIRHHMVFLVVFVILADYLWRTHDFRFSYQAIRILVIFSWVFFVIAKLIGDNEVFAIGTRATGPYWWAYWTLLLAFLVVPAILFHKKWGRNKWVILLVVVIHNFTVSFELFIILTTQLHNGVGSYNQYAFLARYWIIPPLTYTLFLVGIELIFFKNRRKKVTAETADSDTIDHPEEE